MALKCKWLHKLPSKPQRKAVATGEIGRHLNDPPATSLPV